MINGPMELYPSVIVKKTMARLTGQLKTQVEESDKLEGEIKKNLAGLGYEC